jgi:hypothetical protein
LPGVILLTAICPFAAGLEAGQLATFTLMLVPCLVLTRIIVDERIRVIVVSAFVANIAWNALTGRAAGLGDGCSSRCSRRRRW